MGSIKIINGCRLNGNGIAILRAPIRLLSFDCATFTNWKGFLPPTVIYPEHAIWNIFAVVSPRVCACVESAHFIWRLPALYTFYVRLWAGDVCFLPSTELRAVEIKRMAAIKAKINHFPFSANRTYLLVLDFWRLGMHCFIVVVRRCHPREHFNFRQRAINCMEEYAARGKRFFFSCKL